MAVKAPVILVQVRRRADPQQLYAAKNHHLQGIRVTHYHYRLRICMQSHEHKSHPHFANEFIFLSVMNHGRQTYSKPLRSSDLHHDSQGRRRDHQRFFEQNGDSVNLSAEKEEEQEEQAPREQEGGGRSDIARPSEQRAI